MSNISQAPFLRQQREFPSDDLKQLARQSDQAYIDVASKVNARTIGTFATGNQIITGEKWYLQGVNAQQTLRQVYLLTSASVVTHGIDFAAVSQFTRIYGSYTDGTNWYPIPNEDITVTPTQIVLGGAFTITSGNIVLEWLSIY